MLSARRRLLVDRWVFYNVRKPQMKLLKMSLARAFCVLPRWIEKKMRLQRVRLCGWHWVALKWAARPSNCAYATWPRIDKTRGATTTALSTWHSLLHTWEARSILQWNPPVRLGGLSKCNLPPGNLKTRVPPHTQVCRTARDFCSVACAARNKPLPCLRHPNKSPHFSYAASAEFQNFRGYYESKGIWNSEEFGLGNFGNLVNHLL